VKAEQLQGKGQFMKPNTIKANVWTILDQEMGFTDRDLD